MTGDSKSVHFSGNWGVLGVPLATFLGAWPGQVCACPRELQRGHGMHRRMAEGRGRWGCRWTLVGGQGFSPHLCKASCRAEELCFVYFW